MNRPYRRLFFLPRLHKYITNLVEKNSKNNNSVQIQEIFGERTAKGPYIYNNNRDFCYICEDPLVLGSFFFFFFLRRFVIFVILAIACISVHILFNLGKSEFYLRPDLINNTYTNGSVTSMNVTK